MDSKKLSMYMDGTSTQVTKVLMHGQDREPFIEVELETRDFQRQPRFRLDL